MGSSHIIRALAIRRRAFVLSRDRISRKIIRINKVKINLTGKWREIGEKIGKIWQILTKNMFFLSFLGFFYKKNK